MPRPYPWLPRLSDIRRSVSNSHRSDYTRRDLELLFKVSPSAAGRLMDLLATSELITAHLVAREKLAAFLQEVAETDDVHGLCERIRAKRENLTRIKSRYLWLRDESETPLASLPPSIAIEPGRMEIRSVTVEGLVSLLGQLTLAMNDDPVAFAAAWEPQHAEESDDARAMRQENELLDAYWQSPEGLTRLQGLTPAQRRFIQESGRGGLNG